MGRVLVFGAALLSAFGQIPNATPLPSAVLQFVDANGVPLAGGKLYTCIAGLTCALTNPPANARATYTDSTAMVQNTNPIVLDSAGRAQVWGGANAYRLVLTDANGIVQWTQDNVVDLSLYLATIPPACSFNMAHTFKACLSADPALSADHSVTVSDTSWSFDTNVISPNVLPPSNLSGSLGFMGTEWLAAHIQSIYNYGSGAMSIFSNTGLIAIDTHASQPIQFYTNNTLRGQFLGSGTLELASLAGSGNKCTHVNNSGDLAITGADCLDPTVATTFTAQQTFSWGAGPSILLLLGASPVTNLSGSIGDIAHHFSALFTPSLYDYSSTPFSIYADTQQITLDTNANQPIQFYTTGTLRGQFLGAGGFSLTGLAGGGNQGVCVDNTGKLYAHAAGSC
jgi:hypothetical protein